MDDIQTLAALGRTALIGSLYDSRKQRFINDVRLFNFNKLPSEIIQKVSNGNSFFKVCTEDTYSKKLDLMNITGDTSLKALCLPSEVKGSAKFINEFKKRENSVKWNLLYSRTTVHETINLEEIHTHYSTQKIMLNDALFEGATHVVTGIDWGSNAVMSVEYENNRNEPRKAIEKTLSSQFEKLKLIETSMGGIIDSAKPFEQLKESFKCEIKADIPDLDGTFTSLEEAEASFKNIPRVIKDFGKGIQLQFHLSSLDRIKKIFGAKDLSTECEKSFNELDDEFYENFYETLQNIVAFKQKHSDERDLCKSLERDENNLKRKFFKNLVNFRSSPDRNRELFDSLETVVRELEALGDHENEHIYRAGIRDNAGSDQSGGANGENGPVMLEKLKELAKMSENLSCDKIFLLKDDLFKKLTCQNKQSFDPEDKDYFQNLEKMEVVLNRKLNNRIQVYKNNKSIFNPIDLNELKKLKSECANLYFSKGYALHNMNRQKEAIQCFDQVIALNANYTNAYNNKGNALQSLNKFNEAIKCYNTAIEIDPEYADAYYNKGNALSNLYKFRLAVACYDKALQYNPNYAHAYNNKGNALRKLNEYSEAINCYNKSLEINPNNILAINNKKLALEELRKNKNVEVLTDADTMFQKGNSLFNANDFTQAIEFYNKVLEINPDYTYAYAFKGIALDNLKKYEEAIECYDHVIELDPNDSDSYFNKGNSLYDLQRYEKAIECYEKVIELDPKDAYAYNNKGNALRKLNRHTEAIHCYDKTIELNPNHALAHSNKNLALEEIIREIIKNKEADRIERV